MKRIYLIFLIGVSLICLTSCHLLLGHEYEFVYCQKATCTSIGYDLYKCVCGKEEKRNIVDKLEHSYEKHIISETTCTQIGEIQYICTTCLDTKFVQASEKLLPHSIVIDYGVDSTCTTNGLSEGSHCSTCKNVIIQQERLPLKAHTDNDIDGYCDECQTLLEIIYSIKNIADLKNMVLNPQLSYRLDANINLEGVEWQPLFSEQNQFFGKFYGNGHSIDNFVSTNSKICSLFGYNSGYISNLKVSNFTVKLNNISSLIGTIAAINTGVIENCIVKDIFVNGEYLHCEQTKYPSYSGTTATFNLIMGGVVGENFGKLVSNHIEGVFEKQFQVYNKYYLDPAFFYLDTDYKSICNLNLTIGGIVGNNNNLIKDCNNKSIDQTKFIIKSEIDEKGLSIAQVNCKIDGIAPITKTNIEDCYSLNLNFIKDVQESKVSSNGYNGVKCILKINE